MHLSMTVVAWYRIPHVVLSSLHRVRDICARLAGAGH